VVGVIETNADDLANTTNTRTDPNVIIDNRQLRWIKRRKSPEFAGAEGVSANIKDVICEGPEGAVGVNEPRRLVAGIAVSDQFQDVSLLERHSAVDYVDAAGGVGRFV
jgi:hypothetical protein